MTLHNFDILTPFEACGNIIDLAFKDNIVDIKPTVGLVSRHFIVPVSDHQDAIGPLARMVKDAAKILQVIVKTDPNDSYIATSPFKDRPHDYLAACKLSSLEGKCTGIARIASAGAANIDNADSTAFAQWKKRECNPVISTDFVSNLAQYLRKLKRNPQNTHIVKQGSSHFYSR